jgi:hypothetical protein
MYGVLPEGRLHEVAREGMRGPREQDTLLLAERLGDAAAGGIAGDDPLMRGVGDPGGELGVEVQRAPAACSVVCRVVAAHVRLQYRCPRSQCAQRKNTCRHAARAHTTNGNDSTRPCHRRPVEWTRAHSCDDDRGCYASLLSAQPEGSE